MACLELSVAAERRKTVKTLKSCLDAELHVQKKLLAASGGRTSIEIKRDEECRRLRAVPKMMAIEDKHRWRERQVFAALRPSGPPMPLQDVGENNRVHLDRVRAGAAGAPPARDELPGSHDESDENDSNDAETERDSSDLEDGEESQKSPRPLHEWPEDDPYLMSSDAASGLESFRI